MPNTQFFRSTEPLSGKHKSSFDENMSGKWWAWTTDKKWSASIGLWASCFICMLALDSVWCRWNLWNFGFLGWTNRHLAIIVGGGKRFFSFFCRLVVDAFAFVCVCVCVCWRCAAYTILISNLMSKIGIGGRWRWLRILQKWRCHHIWSRFFFFSFKTIFAIYIIYKWHWTLVPQFCESKSFQQLHLFFLSTSGCGLDNPILDPKIYCVGRLFACLCVWVISCLGQFWQLNFHMCG